MAAVFEYGNGLASLWGKPDDGSYVKILIRPKMETGCTVPWGTELLCLKRAIKSQILELNPLTPRLEWAKFVNKHKLGLFPSSKNSPSALGLGFFRRGDWREARGGPPVFAATPDAVRGRKPRGPLPRSDPTSRTEKPQRTGSVADPKPSKSKGSLSSPSMKCNHPSFPPWRRL